MGIFDRFPSTKLNDVNLDWILKKIRALRGGTANQVLTKASDADFDFKWVTGGSGGTSDYNYLDNQPQINNVTLIGNKSASDLGLLDSAALTPYRTAVAQDTIDAGKQSKIVASGILKGDGNGGVTAATAGTDYQAPLVAGTDYETPEGARALGLTGAQVGDIVRVNAVDANGRPTSWNHVPLNEIVTNINYIDNWYFVGGGSQLGNGVFPINQRGQTVYSNAGYGIDRWAATSSNLDINIQSDFTRITKNTLTDNPGLLQVVNTSLVGTELTFSILYRTNSSAVRLNNGISTKNIPVSNDWNVAAFTFVLRNSSFGSFSNLPLVIIQLTSEFGSSDYFDIVAVKLELGSVQTLAHLENGVWVLNEIPDYGEELAKCKLYFERIGGTYQTFGLGGGTTSNDADFMLYISPKSNAFMSNKQKVPTANITASGNFYINGSGIAGKNAPVTNMLNYTELTYLGVFRFSVATSANLTVGSVYTIQAKDTAAYIEITCEP